MFTERNSDHRRLRPNPALVVSIVALVLAFAGGATAKTLITGKQLKNGSLTGADIKDKSLTARDIKGAGAALAGPAGPTGPKGDTGAPGPQGPKGDPGLSNLHTVTVKDTLGAGETKFIHADCPSGEKATGGGVDAGASDVDTRTNGAHTIGLDPTPVGWVGGFINRSAETRNVFVQAICGS